MKIDELIKIISECCNDVIFEYNGKKSGITSEVHNFIPTFQAWHGDSIKEYRKVNDVITDPFYSGKSIVDLVETVNFTFA